LVSLDDAVIARFKKGEEHFEVLVDPYLAADLIEGKEVDIYQILAIDTIFCDSKKGEHASDESLQSVFGTTNVMRLQLR
jgi:ribosome maturation protein SDO1